MTDHPRTLRAIAERYDRRRDHILTLIRDGISSPSMSGIEYYPKAWAALDMADPNDFHIISANLTWNGEEHDFEPLRRREPEEMRIGREISQLFYEPCSRGRDIKMALLRELLRREQEKAL